MALRILISPAQVKARFSESKLKEALDDENAGDINPEVIDALIVDSSSYVLETYYGVFGEVPPAVPHALTRLALDAAAAYLAQRAPEVFKQDWMALFKWIDLQLKKLKEGDTRVGETPPDPAANHGGEVTSTNQDNPCPPRFVFQNGFGIF
jgi:phage gp36-like protein